MNPFKLIVYPIVWTLVLLSNNIFYSKTVVRNRKKLKIKTPTIFVSNHPNTLYDPLIVALRMNRFVHFLINASLFKNPAMGWFLRNTVGIEVQRKEDVGTGSRLKNDEAFKLAEDFLINGGCLFIAPEGGSDIPRRLRKLKTGTARIALNTENRNDFDTELEILPVGLNYTMQTDFRSQIFINIGEGIKVSDFRKKYEEDAFQAALDLTKEMEVQVKNLLIHTVDDEEDAFMRKLEVIAQTENKLPLDKAYDRTKKMILGWRQFKTSKIEEAQQFKKDVNSYFDFLKKNKIRDSIVMKNQESGFTGNWLMRSMMMVIGFPIFIYGWLNNFLANYFPWLAYNKSGLHPAYTSAIKTLAGIFTYSLFYFLQIKLVGYFFGNSWSVVGLYVLSIIATGLFAWWYKGFFKDTMSGWRFSKKVKEEIIPFLEIRKSIVSEINLLTA